MPKREPLPKNPETMQKFAAALELSAFRRWAEWQRAAGIPQGNFFEIRTGMIIPNVVTAIVIARAAGVAPEMLWAHLADERQARQTRSKKSPGRPRKDAPGDETPTKNPIESENADEPKFEG